ncbi:Uncharacterised protein [Mycoplasmopsis citelli]|uniref:Uncharacterized protein n=1 Tax=Mycoplasmopsis citelli TaxID=171281 RepID=A0A449B1Y7_9BACT|nr:hypothetical protein [Mycoplasmopsis citelli]VEU74581.1 Uncharacterised protein [Mycoplasmopsis citelli]
MKKITDKFKMIILGGTASVLLAAIIGTSVAISKNSSSSVKNATLADFEFTSNKDLSTLLASDYATENKTHNIQVNSKYWTEELFFKNFPTSSDLAQREFILRAKNGTLLNAFKDKFLIEFHSYANDLEGELFLKVTLTDFISKIGTPQKTEKIFTLKGFKKVNFESQKQYLFVNSADAKLHGLVDFNSLTQIKDKYNQDNTNDKEALLKSIVSFDLPNSTLIDYSKSVVSFDDKNITIKPYLLAKVNFANLNNLDQISTLSSTNESFFGPEISVNLQNYFDIKNDWGNKVSLSAVTKKLSELTLEEIEKSYDLKTSLFKELKLDNIPAGNTYKFQQNINKNGDEVIFRYDVYSSQQLLIYTGLIKLKKDQFKNS